MTTSAKSAAQAEPSLSLYFGYGSNLWIDQMNRRCPENKFVGVGLLPDWRWIINERGYANIVPSEGDKVYGLLFTISAADEKVLDVYEGVPISYEKKIISVQHFGAGGDSGQKGGEYEIVDALVYVDFQRVTEDKPRKEYIDRMNMGIGDALKEGVPKEYVERYMRPFIPTVSVRVPDQDNDGPGGEVDE